MRSYSRGTSGSRLSLQQRSSFQGRQRDERRRAGPKRCLRGGDRLIRIEAVHACTQLTVLVPQLPIGFGEPFEPFGQASRLRERSRCDEDGCNGEQPQKSQQNSYLTERLATVSTACHNTPRLPACGP